MQTFHRLEFDEIRIENTNRCGYRCFFCPRESMTRTQGVMPLADLEIVLQRVGGHAGRVDLHGFGEPLLDRDIVSKVALVKATWPDARPTLYSTLGVPVSETFFEELIEAGLAELEVSFYGAEAASYAKVHGVNQFKTAKANLDRLLLATSKKPHFDLVLRDHPVHDSTELDAVSRMELSEFQKKLAGRAAVGLVQRELHNFGQGRSYNAPRDDLTCSVVWGYRRRILQVTWDLRVIPCCFDFNASVVFGDLRNQELSEIFTNDAYQTFIQAHQDNRLDAYPVCAACERCQRA